MARASDRDAGAGSHAALGSPDEEPIVLAGEPRRLRGSVVLTNDGDEPLVLRRLSLTPAETKRGTAARPARIRPGTRLPPVRLEPGARRTVPLRLRLDPTTPPGEYRETIAVGGLRREVVLQVSERIDLRLRPALIVVPNVPGGKHQAHVAVENRGNVPLVVPEFLVAVLDDERFECRVLRRALAEIDSETATFEGYLDQLIRSGKATLEDTSHLGIHVAGGPVHVSPGATVPLGLTIQIPERLDRHSRYRGVVPVATSDLVVVVAPIGVPGDGPGPSGPSEKRDAEASNSKEPS